MSAIDRLRKLRAFARPAPIVAAAAALGVAGIALAADVAGKDDAKVSLLLKTRLPKTPINKLDCDKIDGLCEVTSGANLFYVNHGARYLIIGRVYDMETRQDLTAARLLEINPDMLVGGAAKANAAVSDDGEAGEIGLIFDSLFVSARHPRRSAPSRSTCLGFRPTGPLSGATGRPNRASPSSRTSVAVIAGRSPASCAAWM